MNGRLENLELALGVSMDNEEDYDGQYQGNNLDGLLERVTKLESLSRMTQEQLCFKKDCTLSTLLSKCFKTLL